MSIEIRNLWGEELYHFINSRKRFLEVPLTSPHRFHKVSTMKICIYGKTFDPVYAEPIRLLFENLRDRGVDISVYDQFHTFLSGLFPIPGSFSQFHSDEELRGTDVLLSIGGDGTMLDCARIVGKLEIPVIGINTGRLGFLSTVGLGDILKAMESLIHGKFSIDRRSMIEVRCPEADLGNRPFALNEVSILNRERNSMISIHTYVNDVFMNTYWADGLIASTPTGSTAYSLSCGGPIVTPESQILILTPIAAHNLTVRPVVLSNSHTIRLMAEGRDPGFLLMIDGRSYQVGSGATIELVKAPFDFHLIALEGQDFFQTIRAKMVWGIDKRN